MLADKHLTMTRIPHCSHAKKHEKTHPPLFSSRDFDDAFTWLCASRKYFPADADIWHLRFHWTRERENLLSSVNRGEWCFSPLTVTRPRHGERRALWSSTDALIIKCIAQKLTDILPTHPRCEHVAGHGGGKDSIGRVHSILKTRQYGYVCRTDIKGYYANIDKIKLFNQIQQYIRSPELLGLIWQFLHYSVEFGGNFHTPTKGIARGAALSPLLAAFHLYSIDDYFGRQSGVYYARYMDDFIIFTRTRWHLRRAVQKLNVFLSEYGFQQHPDKTFIGSIAKGFDWMGSWFTDKGRQSVAPRALSNLRDKLHRLYEQMRNKPEVEKTLRMVTYLKRWLTWARFDAFEITNKPTGSIILNGECRCSV